MSANDHARTGSRHRQAVALAASAAAATAPAILWLAWPGLTLARGWTPEQASWPLAGGFAGAALGLVLAQPLARRFGRGWVLFAGLAASAGLHGLLGSATNVWLATAIAAVAALFAVMPFVVCLAAMDPPNRRIGPAIGALSLALAAAMGGLVADLLGTDANAYAAVLLTGTVLPVLGWTERGQAGGRGPMNWTDWRQRYGRLRRARSWYGPGLIGAIGGVGIGGIAAGLPAALAALDGAGAGAASANGGFGLALALLGLWLGASGWPLASARWPSGRVFLFALALGAIGGAGAIIAIEFGAPGLGAVAGGGLIALIGAGAVLQVCVDQAAEAFAEIAEQAVLLVLCFTCLAAAIGALAAGHAAPLAGPWLAAAGALGFGGIGALALYRSLDR